MTKGVAQYSHGLCGCTLHIDSTMPLNCLRNSSNMTITGLPRFQIIVYCVKLDQSYDAEIRNLMVEIISLANHHTYISIVWIHE